MKFKDWRRSPRPSQTVSAVSYPPEKGKVLFSLPFSQKINRINVVKKGEV